MAPLSLTAGPSPSPDFIYEQARLLHGREVAALRHVRPADDVVGALGEGAGRGGVERLAREVGEGGRRLAAFARLEGEAAFLDQPAIVPSAGREAAGHDVEHDVRDQPVLRID